MTLVAQWIVVSATHTPISLLDLYLVNVTAKKMLVGGNVTGAEKDSGTSRKLVSPVVNVSIYLLLQQQKICYRYHKEAIPWVDFLVAYVIFRQE